jgi:phage protein D
MENSRKAYAQVTYDGQNITDELNPILLSLTYTDNIDEADDIRIQFIDEETILGD